MAQNKQDLSRINKKYMLSQLLADLNLDYSQFSAILGMNRITLYRYRKGALDLRLSMEQVHRLEEMLEKIGLRLKDLPPDWIRDNHASSI